MPRYQVFTGHVLLQEAEKGNKGNRKSMLYSVDFEHHISCCGLINILFLTGNFVLNIKSRKCRDAGLDSFHSTKRGSAIIRLLSCFYAGFCIWNCVL